MKKIFVIIAILISFFVGKYTAIYNAELIGVDNNRYFIAFSGSVHEYSYTED